MQRQKTMANSSQQSSKFQKIEKKLIKDGNPARYRLQTYTDHLDQSGFRKLTYGKRDKNKPHKIILMVGETGTGKTTLINVMINYMLDVQREDKIWFEITDDQSDRTSAYSQTSKITVYGFYLQESPTDLTIIDTPGYGDTRGVENNEEISTALFNLSTSEEGINEIHTVCLVNKATQTHLSDRQIYRFNAVQSLFRRDIAENIVLLFTHSNGRSPKNALTAVKEAKIKCAVNKKRKPVYFLFDNCQSEPADDEDEDEDGEEDDEDDNEEPEKSMDQSWKLSFKGMKGLFKFIKNIKRKNFYMTQDVLQKWKQLEAEISHLQSRLQLTELKQNELKQTQDALKKNKEVVENNTLTTIQYEVDVPYKKKVDIDPSVSSMAMSCTVCEENCHYPGCWWFSGLSKCSVVKDDHCTVCTHKCHYKEHVKAAHIYIIKTKKEKKTYEGLKKKYGDTIGNGESLIKKLEEELQELEKEKLILVTGVFYSIKHLDSFLELFTLNTDSVITLEQFDYLIEKLKEINKPDMAETLENIKKRAGGGKQNSETISD